MTEEEPENFHWIIMFRRGSKLYPYLNKSIAEMVRVVKKSHEDYGYYPYRMWVVVEDEIQKVVIE